MKNKQLWQQLLYRFSRLQEAVISSQGGNWLGDNVLQPWVAGIINQITRQERFFISLPPPFSILPPRRFDIVAPCRREAEGKEGEQVQWLQLWEQLGNHVPLPWLRVVVFDPHQTSRLIHAESYCQLHLFPTRTTAFCGPRESAHNLAASSQSRQQQLRPGHYPDEREYVQDFNKGFIYHRKYIKSFIYSKLNFIVSFQQGINK